MGSCYVNEDESIISTTDKTLCANKTYWDTMETDYYYGVQMKGVGSRCKGTLKHTIYPWYTFYNGDPFSYSGLKKNCEDNSDRVYEAATPCQNRTY